MGTNFFTNEKENTLLEKIEGVFKYKKVHFFDALVGYFRASGYFRIRKFIQQTPHIRILVGINVDKLTYQANQQGLLFNPNSEQSQEEFFNDIKKNIQEAEYDKEVEDGMYVVEGPKIEKMLGYTNLDSEKGFAFFQKFLKEAGILDELEAKGIQEGDTVRMYGLQFDYYK